jgi:hypothetical protein
LPTLYPFDHGQTPLKARRFTFTQAQIKGHKHLSCKLEKGKRGRSIPLLTASSLWLAAMF